MHLYIHIYICICLSYENKTLKTKTDTCMIDIYTCMNVKTYINNYLQN